MNDDSQEIWSYTAGDLRAWMTDQHDFFHNNDEYRVRFPDPASLTTEQTDELHRRIRETLNRNLDFPDAGIQQTAWHILYDMGLIDEGERTQAP